MGFMHLKGKCMHLGTPLLVPIACILTHSIIYSPSAGKTTLSLALGGLFKQDKLSAVMMSIDDFYVTNKEQKQLAASNPGNGLLQFRGNAGTHDLDLGR